MPRRRLYPDNRAKQTAKRRRNGSAPRPSYPSHAARQAAYRQRQRQAVYLRSRSQEWATPQDVFDRLHDEFGFTLDVCATPANAKCARFYTRAEDGLQQPWEGVCWCNPPYGRGVGAWVQKAAGSAQAGATVVCLVPARTDTRWWHTWIMPYADIRYLPGRLKFGYFCPTPANVKLAYLRFLLLVEHLAPVPWITVASRQRIEVHC